jgi:dephospho-CoA kinase
LEAEARRRLAKMIPDGEKLGQVDFVIRNDGSLSGLKTQVEALWASLQRRASAL